MLVGTEKISDAFKMENIPTTFIVDRKTTSRLTRRDAALRATKHTHHPVDDAKGNAEAMLAMVRGFDLKIRL